MRLPFVLLSCSGLIVGGCGSEKTAQQVFAAGNYIAAYELFKPLAEAGDRVAQNYLGVHYYLGLGVPRDWQQALQWYGKAAQQGDPGAQLNYGLMFQNAYGTERDIVAAFMWYYASYRQGNATAGRYLGSLAAENKLSPNQMNYAKLQAGQYITDPVVAEQVSAGKLFRGQRQAASGL